MSEGDTERRMSERKWPGGQGVQTLEDLSCQVENSSFKGQKQPNKKKTHGLFKLLGLISLSMMENFLSWLSYPQRARLIFRYSIAKIGHKIIFIRVPGMRNIQEPIRKALLF